MAIFTEQCFFIHFLVSDASFCFHNKVAYLLNDLFCVRYSGLFIVSVFEITVFYEIRNAPKGNFQGDCYIKGVSLK